MLKQECIPVGCVPPAAVAVLGGLHQTPRWEQTTPLDQAPPMTRHPTGTRHPPRAGTFQEQASPWEQAPPTPRSRHPLPPVNRITDTCKNITFPQLHLRAVMKRTIYQLVLVLGYKYHNHVLQFRVLLMHLSGYHIRVFSKCTRMAILPILASEALFHVQKNSVRKCCPSEY